MSFLKNLLKRYKAAPRNDATNLAPLQPTLNPKQQYLHNLWQENTTDAVQSQKSISVSTSASGLGLLFIIIDDLPHEFIWRAYIELHNAQLNKETGSSDKRTLKNNPLRIWIHAKYPQRVRRYLHSALILV